MPIRHALIIAGFSVLLFLPAFILGAGGGDLQCQSLWVKLFTAQFWQGDIYPRWLQDMYAGSGSPVFFYYPPLTYFITAFFTFLSPLDAFGYYPIAASALLATILSGVTFYLWMKEEILDGKAVLIGSLLYISAPFHIAHNFYYILLFSSVWSYAWLPLLFLYARRVAQGKAYSVQGLAFALCLLVITNLPMTMIMGTMATAYALLYITRERKLSRCVPLGFAIISGFLLSAFYLLPSLLYMNFADVYRHWDAQKGFTGYNSTYFILGFKTATQIAYTALALGSAILALLYFKNSDNKSDRIFFLAASLAACFMLLPASLFIWEMLPMLKTLQSSVRFLAVPVLCLAAFATLCASRLRALSYALLLLYVAMTFATAWNSRISIEQFRKDFPVQYEQYTLNIDQYDNYLTSPNLFLRYYRPEGLADVKNHRERVEVISGNADIKVLEWRPRSIRLQYSATQPSTLRIRQFDFPGFKAFLNTQELDIRRDEDTGQIVFDIPKDKGDILLELTKLPAEIGGVLLSILALATILLLYLAESRKRKNRPASG